MLYPFLTRFTVKLAYKKQLTPKPISGIPKGIRTPVTAVKGRCPRPLDDRDTKIVLLAYETNANSSQKSIIRVNSVFDQK